MCGRDSSREGESVGLARSARPEEVVLAVIDAVRGSTLEAGLGEAFDHACVSAVERASAGDDLLLVLGDLLDEAGAEPHAWVRTSQGDRWPTWEPSGGEGALRDRARADASVESPVTDGPVTRARLTDGTLYLRALGRGSATPEDGASLGQTLAEHIRGEGDGRAVVIDLRFGAWMSVPDALALAQFVAADNGVLLHEQRVDQDGGSALGPALPVEGEPTATGTGIGPIVLLTGAGTRGGSEAFVLATVGNPRVTRVGDPTRGDLTIPRMVRLPNAWRLRVPGGRLLARDLRDYSSDGIPPHIVASDDRRTDAADPAIGAALEYLGRLRRAGLLP